MDYSGLIAKSKERCAEQVAQLIERTKRAQNPDNEFIQTVAEEEAKRIFNDDLLGKCRAAANLGKGKVLIAKYTIEESRTYNPYVISSKLAHMVSNTYPELYVRGALVGNGAEIYIRWTNS